jgi:hypothetical protein
VNGFVPQNATTATEFVRQNAPADQIGFVPQNTTRARYRLPAETFYDEFSPEEIARYREISDRMDAKRVLTKTENVA